MTLYLYDPLYLLSSVQVDSKRENMDESNMFKENIIKGWVAHEILVTWEKGIFQT